VRAVRGAPHKFCIMTFDNDIQTVLRDLNSKDWSVRFRSLEKLQELVAAHADDPTVWTREILVALHKPLLVQLKDLRSSIVREVRCLPAVRLIG
jgi:hypothetical protein